MNFKSHFQKAKFSEVSVACPWQLRQLRGETPDSHAGVTGHVRGQPARGSHQAGPAVLPQRPGAPAWPQPSQPPSAARSDGWGPSPALRVVAHSFTHTPFVDDLGAIWHTSSSSAIRKATCLKALSYPILHWVAEQYLCLGYKAYLPHSSSRSPAVGSLTQRMSGASHGSASGRWCSGWSSPGSDCFPMGTALTHLLGDCGHQGQN